MNVIAEVPLIRLAGAYDIGKGFKADTCYGPVLVSGDVFFLIVVKRLTAADMAGALIGGLAGAAVGAIFPGSPASGRTIPARK